MKFILTIFFAIILFGAKGQQVTKDTTFVGWNARITYYPGRTDSSECIIFFPGAGEVGTDITKLRIYGPHYWLMNGWDGSVPLGNGVHYPILISLQPVTQLQQPPVMKQRIDAILARFKIKKNALHFTGPSAGGNYSSMFASYQPTAGDHSYGRMVKSVCVPESVKPGNIFDATPAYPTNMVQYAQIGGKLLGFDQINDGGRDMQTYTVAMNNAVPGSATRIVTDFGSGGHCCFENFWNPNQANWTASNPSVVSLGTGSWVKENVYQWMLRNGDTSISATLPLNANAGATQTITLPLSSVTLNANASTGNITSYSWTKVSGGTATINSPAGASTTVTGLTAGTYVFKLTIGDGATSSSANVTIIVNPAVNQSPIANAGSNQTITLPTNTITLNGTASTDPDGTINNFNWTKISGPASGVIVSAANATTVVNSLVAGTYLFSLTVTDNSGATASAQVTIIVNPVPNQSPIAVVGTNQIITLPINSVTLNGSGSSDPDGTIASYSWTKISGPLSGILANANAVTTALNTLIAGTYVYQLTVTDNNGASNSAQITITVNLALNQAPTAVAGSNLNITLPINSVTLNGSGSSDPDGTIAGYSWTKISGPAAGTLTSPGTAATDVNGLIAGTYVYQLTVTDNSGASNSAQISILVNPAPNQAPVANAGSNLTITLPTNNVTLNGSGSSDPDGTISSYSWTKISGPSAGSLSSPGTVATDLNGLIAGTYVYQLTVTDNNGATASAQVSIGVNAAPNQAPIAAAGANLNITLPTNSVTLNGSGSSDPDGTIASYGWSEISGPSVASLSNPSAASPDLNGLTAGTYVYQLTVTDNDGASASAQISIAVNAAPNQAPTAVAGSNLTITLPTSSVTLNGSGSSDPDGSIASYSWTKISGPSTGTLTNANVATTDLNGLTVGTYIYQLTVTDNNGASASSQVSIVVNPAPNQAPIASAGSNITITLPTNSVTLNGSGSSDPDGTISSYSWTKVSGPSSGTLTNANVATTDLNGLTAGTYIYQLTVTDNNGASASSQVSVVVNPAPNQAPTAVAGSNLTITLPANSVTLNGSGSSDPDGSIASYSWTKVSGPSSGTLTNANVATTDLNGLTAGTYIYQLTVTDNNGASASAQVSIVVNPAPNQAPIAVAGSNLTITLPTNSVTLNGSGSNDPDGSIASYSWTKVSGPSSGTLTNANVATTDLNGLTVGTYIYQLTVTDNNGASASAQVSIVVNPAPNQAPIASAGSNITITLPTNNTTLDGSGSNDPDGTIASYSWTKVSGPSSGTLANAGAVTTALNGLTAGTYVYQLTITDNNGASASAQVSVVVNPAPNQAPVAVAGSNLTITLPTNSVTLNGSGSSDPDGTIASYSWTKVTGPSSGTLTNANVATTDLNGLTVGTYVYQLTVTDNNGASASSQISIVVNPAPNQSPVAIAGSNITITLPTNNTTLDGSGSNDPDGTIASYSWTKLSGPSSGTVANAGAATTGLNGLTAGTYVYQLTITDNNGATASAQVSIVVNPAPNQAPIASAGSNITITLPINNTTLDGSGSNDPDGTIASYSWTKVSGPSSGTLTNANVATTDLNGLIVGTYVYQLTVTDNNGASASSQVSIVVNPAPNQAPIANAGSNITITLPTNIATLDGSGSNDPDGTIASYSWTKVSGPSSGTLANAGAVSTDLNGLTVGTYVYQLTITDNNGATSSAQVSIVVNPAPNQAPIANAGSNITITLPTNNATLDGSGSSDPDGTIASYSWTKVSGPSSGTLTNANAATTDLNGLTAGTYVYQLTVTDNNGATASAQVSIGVDAAPNQAPTAIAGSNITISLPTNSVTLNGSGSSDPDGSITNYSWTKISGPSSGSLVNASASTTDLNGLTAGTYVYQLTVTDNNGATASAQISIDVNPAPNQAPIADAGSNITITLPTNSVTLNGSGSNDPDGSIASYSWTKISGPSSGTLVNAGAATTGLNGLTAGIYVYELTITDNNGATASAQVFIAVNPAANQTPIANAGSNITITLPTNSVTLDGSGSSDPDGTIASYSWTKISGPSSGSLSSPNAASSDLSGLTVGTYIYQLTITDNNGATASAQISIDVNAAPNQLPVANAGSNITITLPTNSVTLDGSGSSDPDGTIASYSWTKISGPSSGTLANAGASTTDLNGLTIGTYVYQLTVTDNNGATASGQVSVVVNPALNQAPIANAGSNITISLPTNSVTLDGSASSDPDGTIASYSWTKISGPSSGTLANAGAATTDLNGLTIGTYVYQLTVTDNNGATASGQVSVVVNPALNQAPIANAGSNITISLPTNSVTLDGSASSDPDGTIASYSWTKISGPSSGTLANAGAATTDLNGLTAGTYVYQLTITDNNGATASAQVSIGVDAAPNQAPVAIAGSNITITLPTNSVTLNGSGSSDPDGTLASYSWTKVSGPSSGTLADASASMTDLSGLTAGTYVYQLTITDNNGATASAQVSIDVNAAPNQSPTAAAGSNLTITLPTNSVTLDGSGSSDPDGTIVSYTWTKISGPAAGTLSNPNAATSDLNGLTAGTYVYQLTITDNNGATASAQVSINVNPALNAAPVAIAGSDLTITLPTNSVTLNGTGSSDPDGTITSYSWTKISGPSAGTLANAGSSITDLTGLTAGTYIYQLTVTDNSGATSIDQISITVSNAANEVPLANAGAAISIVLPQNAVVLNGGASSDPDGSIVSYAWSQISGPSTASLDNAGSVSTNAGSLQLGQYIFELTITDNQGASATAQISVTVSAPGNQAPLANPGSTTTIVLPSNSVVLNGSGSTDPDGSIATYNWSQVSGPSTASITSAATAIANASGLVAGTYVFSLSVTDNSGATSSATVSIIVVAPANQAPVANAGASITLILPQNTTTLDGSTSTDIDGSIVSYQWAQISGPSAATMTNTNTASASIGALQIGQYTFELTVTDNNGATAKAQVKVTVAASSNIDPVANAGNNQSITLPVASLNLDGSRSFDADGTINGYLWAQVSGPSTIIMTGGNTAFPTLSGFVVGTYVFQLTVTDDKGATTLDQVTIVVNPALPGSPVNQAPVANAGQDILLTLPNNSANLDGSASADPDGNIISYNWKQISGPSTAEIADASGTSTAVNNLVAGEYVFQLVVTDNSGETSGATVKVDVTDGQNQQQLRYTSQVTLYPNPAHDIVHIKLINEYAGRVSITVFDLKGHALITTVANKAETILDDAIDITALRSGMYFVQVLFNDAKQGSAGMKRVVAKLVKL